MTINTAALNWLKSCLRDENPHWPDEQLHPSIADQIWRAGQAHGVLALCNYTLSNSLDQLDSVPPAFRERLKKHTLQAAAVELLQEMELRQVLLMLNREGIKPLLMKGTPLAYSIYPHPYFRPRCDTDLLFPDKNTAETAWFIVQKMGYSRPNAISGEFISHEFSCHKSGHSAINHTLDCHWKLSNSIFFARIFSFDELTAASVPVPSLGKNAWTLNPLHALLNACLHRIAHKPEGNADRLIWLYDIHILCNVLDKKQWDSFVSVSAQKKICDICSDGLVQTSRALATVIPARVEHSLRKNGRNEPVTTDMGSSRWKADLANFQTLPSWKNRLLLLKEHLVPPAEYMIKKYHPGNRLTLPWFYLSRIIKGISKRFK